MPVDEDGEPKKSFKCPCNLSSFNPNGMLERIVLYCMMNICKGKKKEDGDAEKKAGDGGDPSGKDAFADDPIIGGDEPIKSARKDAVVPASNQVAVVHGQVDDDGCFNTADGDQATWGLP